jgi:hypothetical protein
LPASVTTQKYGLSGEIRTRDSQGLACGLDSSGRPAPFYRVKRSREPVERPCQRYDLFASDALNVDRCVGYFVQVFLFREIVKGLR